MNAPHPDFLFVCTGPTCGERGGKEILRAWKAYLVDRGRWKDRRVAPVQCFGECATGPNACSLAQNRFVSAIDPRQATTLIEELDSQPAAR